MYWPEFLAIALAHLVAVASPGPDFAVVLKQSVSHGTRIGVWTSLGVGAGIMLHVAYCLLGVAVLLAGNPLLFNLARWAAALYLFLLGVQALRHSPPSGVGDSSAQSAPAAGQGSPAAQPRALSAVYRGFLTNGLNPKATLFFLALFTVVISPQTPLLVQLLYGLYLAVATFIWFAMLSMLLGREKVRLFFQRRGLWFERAMGIVLIALAVQIALIE